MLTYCMNVHAGELWGDQLAAIRDFAVPIGSRIAGGLPELGVRMSARASEELLDEDTLAATRELLRQTGTRVSSVNAFPFGTFHGTAVKDRVYRPDWSDRARLEYTVRVAQAVAELSEKECMVSVSTCPVTFKGWPGFEESIAAGLGNLARCAVRLKELHEQTGVEVVLCMEPEPCCYPERTDELIAVMRRLWRGGDEEVLRRYIGVCFDTAHQAVEFEDLALSMDALADAGVRVGKVQLSAAIEATCEEGVEELRPYAEPCYLHQTFVQDTAGRVRAFSDLPDAFDASPKGIWRVHYHVPLFAEPFGALRSTSGLLSEESFLAALRRSRCTHFEVETYTWDVWQQAQGERTDLIDGISSELVWVASQMAAVGMTQG